MSAPQPSWDLRLADLWSSIDALEAAPFVAAMDRLTGELSATNCIALFEQASARDSTGSPELAVPLYRAALSNGLSGSRRRRATIQLASSLRNLGKPHEAVELLMVELRQESDELDGAVHAFLALALVDVGREKEAVSLSLTALAVYLPRYNRSLARYAGELVAKPGAGTAE